MEFKISTDELIVILTALKSLEKEIEEGLPCMTYISDNKDENDLLLFNMKLLEDCKQLQADWCFRISK